MGKFLNKRLDRLRRERQENPEYRLMSRNLAAQSGTIDELTRRTTGKLKMTGASPTSLIKAQREGAESISKGANDAYRTAQDAMTGRLERNSDKQDTVQMAIEAEKERERQAKEQSKNGLLKAGLQVGGAILGSVVPGVGTAIGASLGAAAAGFIGGGGKMGTEYADYNQIMQGVTDTVSGIDAATTLSSQKKQIAEVYDFMKAPDYGNYTSDQLKPFKMAIETGNYEEAQKAIKALQFGKAFDPNMTEEEILKAQTGVYQ